MPSEFELDGILRYCGGARPPRPYLVPERGGSVQMRWVVSSARWHALLWCSGCRHACRKELADDSPLLPLWRPVGVGGGREGEEIASKNEGGGEMAQIQLGDRGRMRGNGMRRTRRCVEKWGASKGCAVVVERITRA